VLAALVISLRGELAELARARERIAELEARLRQNPRDSSQPPLGEGLGKPAPRSLRKNTGRRPRGQDGHKGLTLAQVAGRTGRSALSRAAAAGATPGWRAGR